MTRRTDLKITPFVRGYLECALWTSDPDPGSGEWGEHGTWCIDRIPVRCLQAVIAECDAFQSANAADLATTGADDAQNGHDFWLTRNGHGAGFWDRGYGEVGKRLSNAARVYGTSDVYAFRGRIYLT